MRREGFAELDLPGSEEEEELLPEGLEEPVVGLEPLVLEGRGRYLRQAR